MKFENAIKSLLSLASPLASVPTGWAIGASLHQTPVFPMPVPVAVIGAASVIIVDIAIVLLITDIYQYNSEATNQTERGANLSTLPAWAILLSAIVGEIFVTLFMVIFADLLAFGVLVFPVITISGAFVFALRANLKQRKADREQNRAKAKQKRADRKAEREQEKQDESKSEAKTKQEQAERFKCPICQDPQKSQKALNGHMVKHRTNGHKKENLSLTLKT